MPARSTANMLRHRFDDTRGRLSARRGQGDHAEELLRKILNQLDVMRSIPSTGLRLRERAVDDGVDYILGDSRFDHMQVTKGNHETPRAGLAAASVEGTVAEFGVYKGESLTMIAKRFADQTVHGFDSFVGLPEAWGGTSKAKGAFSVGGTPPRLPVDNVEFHVGFFDVTIAEFRGRHAGPFSFVHLDADLYSSTRTVFTELADYFVPGTVVVFDEYFGYHGWQHHEHRAFMEFLEESGFSFEALSLGHMNLAVRLTRAETAAETA